jgi:hypothetical protein
MSTTSTTTTITRDHDRHGCFYRLVPHVRRLSAINPTPGRGSSPRLGPGRFARHVKSGLAVATADDAATRRSAAQRGRSGVIWAVQPHSKKYSDCQKCESPLCTMPSRPTERAYRDRHERGAGCGGRGLRRARGQIAVRFPRERSERSGRPAQPRRQKRVVLAPVAGVKSAEFWSARPGAGKAYSQATEATRICLRRKYAISCKAIACGNAGLIR